MFEIEKTELMADRDPRPVFKKLRSTVIPSVEGYWRADAVVTMFLDSRLSTDLHNSENATCGRVALSAFFGQSAAVRATADSSSPWMNRGMMESALRNLGVGFEKLRGRFPEQGLSLIQWEGPWSHRDFRGSNLVHTHWVAVVDSYVFDVNWPGWLPFEFWEDLVARDLMMKKKATGWSILTSFSIN